MSPAAPGTNPTAGPLHALSLVLLVHGLEEGRRRNLPLLLELDQPPAAVPVLDRLRHELAPRAVKLLKLHRQAPRLFEDGRQRHLEARPFCIGEALGEGGVVIDPADAEWGAFE